jgi:predicted dehydrogenase
MANHLTRRHFLQTTAAATCAGPLLAAEKKISANERLHVAVIGVNGQGNYDMTEVAKAGAEIVALCDVDEHRAVDARKRFPRAAYYTDFRRVFDQKGIDAVVVATPDHMHAFATLAALRAGLHVYCEKPLTHCVAEARLVAETAAKHQRVTQMGTQIHAGDNYRRVVELVQSGVIGPVREVHVWCAKSYGAGDHPKDTPPVPKGLHYDLWLGCAPYRPYHPVHLHFNWRSWWDYGGGTLTDMACHFVDLPFWALKLRHPSSVAAEGSKVHPESAANWLIVHYEFPEREGLPPVKLTWYDGGKQPDVLPADKRKTWGNGVLFVGEKGMLLADYERRRFLPEKQFKDFQAPKQFIPKSIGHHKEWVEACKHGGVTSCNFDYSGALSEAVLLGSVSYRTGRPLTWHAKELKAVNEPEADRYIHKEYRKPWVL